MVAHQVLVAVPVWADFPRRGVLCAAVNLDEAYPAFDEAARQQALPAEGSDVLVFNVVERLGGLGLATQVGGLRRAQLEARGEFVGADARL